MLTLVRTDSTMHYMKNEICILEGERYMNAAAMYSREEVCDYNEAASIIGCKYDAISDAVRMDVLTGVRLPHEMKKYVPRCEVDALAGLKRVTSKEARERLAAVRGPRNYVAEELSSGEPFTMAPALAESEKMRAFTMLHDAFIAAFGSRETSHAR